MLITLDPACERPFYRQIIDQIKEQIMNGLLKPGEELPSVRELSALLEINMHTVHRAYKELKEAGVVQMRLGQRVRIAQGQNAAARPEDIDYFRKEVRRLKVEAFHRGLSDEQIKEILIDEFQGKKEQK